MAGCGQYLAETSTVHASAAAEACQAKAPLRPLRQACAIFTVWDSASGGILPERDHGCERAMSSAGRLGPQVLREPGDLVQPTEDAVMRNGFRAFDADTHVNPAAEVLERYVDPGFRPRLAELAPHRIATGNMMGGTPDTHQFRVATKFYRRVLGEAGPHDSFTG